VARITEYFNFGSTDDMSVEELVVKLQRMYTDLALAINQKPDLFERDVDGQTTDTFLANGSININRTTDKVEMLTNHVSQTAVTWKTLS
jgi:hypothetical protein